MNTITILYPFTHKGAGAVKNSVPTYYSQPHVFALRKLTIYIGYYSYPIYISQFYISYIGIYFKPHNNITQILNSIKNVFNGYWVNYKRRIRKNKLNSFVKRITRKLKL